MQVVLLYEVLRKAELTLPVLYQEPGFRWRCDENINGRCVHYSDSEAEYKVVTFVG